MLPLMVCNRAPVLKRVNALLPAAPAKRLITLVAGVVKEPPTVKLFVTLSHTKSASPANAPASLNCICVVAPPGATVPHEVCCGVPPSVFRNCPFVPVVVGRLMRAGVPAIAAVPTCALPLVEPERVTGFAIEGFG